MSVLYAFEINGLNRIIRGFLRHTHGIGQSDDTQDPAPGRQQTSVVIEPGSRMKDDTVFRFFRYSGNDRSLLGIFRITGRCKNNTQCNPSVPFQLYPVQRSVNGMFEDECQIAFQSRQDRLCFRIAHATIEFERFRMPVLVDHDTGV